MTSWREWSRATPSVTTRGEGSEPWRKAIYNRATIGPGNLLSNVEDLSKWAANLIHPRVGDPALIQQLTAPAQLRDGTPVNYGFGLSRELILGHPAIRHNGGISGFSTAIAAFPEDDPRLWCSPTSRSKSMIGWKDSPASS